MPTVNELQAAFLIAETGATGKTDLPGLTAQWLQGLGYTGTTNEMFIQFFQAGGATSGKFNEAAAQFFVAQGYTGTLPEMWIQFWENWTGGLEMMTFDGSTGYYVRTVGDLTSNSLTLTVRINNTGHTGAQRIFEAYSGAQSRVVLYYLGSDHGSYPGKVICIVYNTGFAVIANILSTVAIDDGDDHLIFFSYDGTAGTALFYIDGVDADDTVGYPGRTLTTGTVLDANSFYIGRQASTSAQFFNGQIGYVGYRDTYLTNPTDFGTGTEPTLVDEVTWTEWGAQPVLWNLYGQMTDNKGSEGDLTAFGTITGPE